MEVAVFYQSNLNKINIISSYRLVTNKSGTYSDHISNTVHQLGHHSYLAKDIDPLEWVQYHATKLVKSLSILPYELRQVYLSPIAITLLP